VFTLLALAFADRFRSSSHQSYTSSGMSGTTDSVESPVNVGRELCSVGEISSVSAVEGTNKEPLD